LKGKNPTIGLVGQMLGAPAAFENLERSSATLELYKRSKEASRASEPSARESGALV
jgi:hypothetical protein